MRQIFTLFTLLVIMAVSQLQNAQAQSPQKMSYQAVIRNSSDKLVTNKAVGMKISILQGSATGTEVYTETQTPSTNANGLVSIEFGGGTGFDQIDWSMGPFFIKTETDPTGSTNYTITGTSQLLSVPYALYAANSGNGISKGIEAGNTPFWNGTKWVTNSSNIFNNGGFVGLGTKNPSNPLSLQHDYVGGGIINSGNGGNGPGYILANNGTEAGAFGLSNGAGNYILGSENGDIALRNASTTRGLLFSTGGTPFDARLAIVANGNIGIGTITPSAKLEVAGNVKIADGTQGKGKVLTSDSTGLATWADAEQVYMAVDHYGMPTFNMLNAMDTVIHFGNTSYISNMVYKDGSITIQKSGIYHFDLAIQFEYVFGNPYSVVIKTYKNNGFLFWDWSNEISKDIKLNAGDVITFKIAQASGSTRSISPWSRLSVHKVN